MSTRRDTTITQERIDELNRVKGWIQPVFVREDPTGREEPHWLISREDGERIAQGYACGRPGCGAIFDIVMPSCVVCKAPIALGELAEMRQEWTDHLGDRGIESGAPVSFDEFMGEVARDPDIEHRKL